MEKYIMAAVDSQAMERAQVVIPLAKKSNREHELEYVTTCSVSNIRSISPVCSRSYGYPPSQLDKR
jgi:hypothetical protein